MDAGICIEGHPSPTLKAVAVRLFCISCLEIQSETAFNVFLTESCFFELPRRVRELALGLQLDIVLWIGGFQYIFALR